ncbi:MAG TPA: phage major capsid protein [Acidimicrobiia bacterium]|nr:phage major capsid protein [Acidimicrobiia bacterium]
MKDVYAERSYFADLLAVAEEERSVARDIDAGYRRPSNENSMGYDSNLIGTALGNVDTSTGIGTKAARSRLTSAMAIRAALTTTDTDGGDFVPTGAPARVAKAFARSVRARSAVAPLLQGVPLPELGMTVEEPKVGTGPTVLGHVENAAVSETDPVTELLDHPVRTIAGQVDLSRQAFLRSGPELDEVIAIELGAAYAEILDSQLVSGLGTGQTLLGLLNVTGITSVAYTDATPTVAEFWPKLMECLSTTSTAWKNIVGSVLIHPRRLAWLHSTVATPPTLPPGVRWVPSAVLPTTDGAGTNEDVIVVLDGLASKLYTRPPQFRVSFEVGSGTGTVKVWAYGFVASGVDRQPKSIGKLAGSGLATPTFA